MYLFRNQALRQLRWVLEKRRVGFLEGFDEGINGWLGCDWVQNAREKREEEYGGQHDGQWGKQAVEMRHAAGLFYGQTSGACLMINGAADNSLTATCPYETERTCMDDGRADRECIT
jgi:hypothetical protein